MVAVEEVVETEGLLGIKEKVVLAEKETQMAVLQEEVVILVEDQTELRTDQTELAEVLAIEVQAVSEEDGETNAYKINYLKTQLVSSAFFLCLLIQKNLSKKSTFVSFNDSTLNASASQKQSASTPGRFAL